MSNYDASSRQFNTFIDSGDLRVVPFCDGSKEDTGQNIRGQLRRILYFRQVVA